MRARFGEKVKLQLVEGDRNFIGRRLSGIALGAQIDASPEVLISALEARALWSRFGL
jgi:hypothetical protein